ncbi:MAG: DUF4065 domain-containing protein [Candidatus Liberibacter ctenarytainae]|uniref:DUF4065 domain-containing protein n=1 Tax=Candidatus Liberibacter ctenarytainae TaxID=2020335 RepID=A0A937DHG9_9HYPH|nr:DUF4065 domain-containing protein [Candidatus Liberibacter ctenarytainae]
MVIVKDTPHDVRAVANYILKKTRINNKGIDCLSIMKLLKLVYFSHGWSLAFYENDVPLVEQLPEAWKYGPVYPDVYDNLSKFGRSSIDTLILNTEDHLPYSAKFSSYQEKIMGFVLHKYDRFSAYDLSDMTHCQGSPWKKTITSKGSYAQISNDIMQKYYRTQVEQKRICLEEII